MPSPEIFASARYYAQLTLHFLSVLLFVDWLCIWHIVVAPRNFLRYLNFIIYLDGYDRG